MIGVREEREKVRVCIELRNQCRRDKFQGYTSSIWMHACVVLTFCLNSSNFFLLLMDPVF